LWLFLALVIVALLAWYFLYPGRTTPAPAPTTAALERGPVTTHGSATEVLASAGRRASTILIRGPQSAGDGGRYGEKG
jgi:hypothetical protein